MASRGGTRGPPARDRQLAFDLARGPCYDADEFLVSASNAQAHATIMNWPLWPDRVRLLIGAAGSGKSHLGAIWAEQAQARIIRQAGDLDIAAFAGAPVALLEDCDRAGFDENEMFHLVNSVKEQAGWLLMTSREPPDRWGIRTPDLLSRLRLAVATSIRHPDAALLRAVLVKLFADRQIRVDADVVHHAALHCEQSLDAMRRFVAAVDDEALATGRRITRPLAIATIERIACESPGSD